MANHSTNKLLFKIALSISFFLFLFFNITEFSKSSNIKLKIEKIKSEFHGKIIKIYATKKTSPTHLKVILSNGKIISISPNQQLITAANVGDYLVKPKNENRIYLIKNKKKLTFFYTKISYETRNNDNFPIEWKNKWPESSEWDKKNETVNK